MSSDEHTRALISRIQRGDESAFSELFRAHKDAVARTVHRYLGPSSDVEDVVQDAFVHVYRSIGSFRGDSKFSTWLYRLTANVTKMHIRKKSSRPRFLDVSMPERRDGVARSETPDDVLDRNARIDALYRLVDALSEKKREVLVLHDFQGLVAKDIADEIGVPVLTVRTRLFYARKELYNSLMSEPALAAVVEKLLGELPGRPKKKREEPRSDEKTARPSRREAVRQRRCSSMPTLSPVVEDGGTSL